MNVFYGRLTSGVSSGTAVPWAGRLVIGGGLAATDPASSGGGGGGVSLTGAVFRQYPFGDFRQFPVGADRQFPRG